MAMTRCACCRRLSRRIARLHGMLRPAGPPHATLERILVLKACACGHLVRVSVWYEAWPKVCNVVVPN